MVPLIAAALLVAATAVAAQEPLPVVYDFEQGPDLAAYPRLTARGDVTVEIVERDGGGHALKVANSEPGKYATVTLNGPFPLARNLALSFDVRAEVEEGKEANYVGVLFYGEDNKQYFGLAPFSEEWQQVEVAVADLNPVNEGPLTLGMPLLHVNLYGRASDRGGPARMTVWIDNLRLEQRPIEGKLTDTVRVSQANPPMFEWPPVEGEALLAWSRDPGFPPDATFTHATNEGWHLPDEPLEPGRWYWRVRTANELREGWSDIAAIDVVPEAHRFESPDLDLAALADEPHPRLFDLAAQRAALTDDDRAQLRRNAESAIRSGIDDDPPIWEEGDPRWPTWIDWYGKVHGGITSRSGRRMEDLARAAALLDDPEITASAVAMARKLASWDVEGGSATGRGDIGSHHVLRGLNHAYDALYDALGEDGRAEVRAAIVERGQQFVRRLFPLRLDAENNHAWLNAYALAQSGLVLLGEHDAAGAWVQRSLDLFVARFLSTLGYQGDNNEGVGYWGYGLGFVIEYADMMREVTGVDLYQHPWLAQTGRFPMYSAPPNAWAVSFADSGQPNHGLRGPTQRVHVRSLGERTGDPYLLWYAGRGPLEDGPYAGLAPKPPVDVDPAIHYRYIGTVMQNTSLVDGREGVTFAMRSGPFFAGHQHEDLNSFVINAYGEKLAIDGGHYDWFGSAHFKGYSTLTRAHNSILVNGQDQGSRKDGADGRITHYFDSPGFGYSVGDVSDPDVYAGQVARFDRRALFIKPGFVVIHDRLRAAGGPAQWDWLLHSVGAIEADAADGRFALTSGDASLAGRFLAPAGLKLDVKTGFPVDPVDRYSTNPVPPERNPTEWTLTATPAEERVDETFLAVMRIARGEARAVDAERLDAGEGTLAARFGDGDETFTLLLRQDATGPMAAGEVAADGETACVSAAGEELSRALLIGGTRLAWRGQPRLTADAPVDAALLSTHAGKRLEVAAAAPVRVGVACSAAPEAVTVNGEPARGEYDAAAGLLRLDLPAGEHVVAYGPRPNEVRSHALPPLAVSVGGEPQALEGYARRRAEGLRHYYWGNVTVPQGDHYRVDIAWPAGGLPPLALIDGNDAPLGDSVWLDAGAHTLLLAGDGPPQRAALVPQAVDAQTAEMLPADYRPPANAIAVEAEAPSAEGEVKGQIMEKVGAVGGVAHCVWDTLGQWAEWPVDVPADGRYTLLIRGCSEFTDIVRGVAIDGQDPGAVVRMSGTGGWSRTSDDWRYFRLPEPLALTKGRHTLRIEQMGGSMNLDRLVLVPEG